jgi:cysteine synthase A
MNRESVALLDSVAGAIGNTPMVALTRACAGLPGRILAKLEYLNPGGSKKDRIARQMIEEAEADGRLRRGDTVIELTSGNTGTGLAIVCALKGYRFVAVMSRGNSIERARMMRALGAEVVLVDQATGSQPGAVSGDDLLRVEAEVQRLVRERRGFRADQFTLTGNRNAHALFTAPEILRQTNGEFDAFCDFIGSGGTFAGCASAFKAHRPSIACYAVEPAGAAVLSGEILTVANHPIQGGGYARASLPLFDPALADGFVAVSGEEARGAARLLARSEGIFGGFSAGANFAAAAKLLRGPQFGKTIVILICDSGLKYLSTDLWA